MQGIATVSRCRRIVADTWCYHIVTDAADGFCIIVHAIMRITYVACIRILFNSERQVNFAYFWQAGDTET